VTGVIMEISAKAKNFERVREVIGNFEADSFTNYDMVKATGLNYEQVKRILASLEEIGEIRYSENGKIYFRNRRQ